MNNENKGFDKDFIELMSHFDKSFNKDAKDFDNNFIEYVNKMREIARRSVLSELFQSISTEEKANAKYEEIKSMHKSMTDEQLDFLGELSGVSEEHLPIHRAILRNEDNEFTVKLSKLEYHLQTGDVILMCGRNIKSASLVGMQHLSYKNARSSHVALVHADFICIDANLGSGVKNSIISQLLSNVLDNWRVIRFNGIKDEELDIIQRKCTYYLNQPYKIIPRYSSATEHSYCSELARKVYLDSNIANTKIPKSAIIKPCDFDKLADTDDNWIDITDKVRPYIQFCQEYQSICRLISKLFIYGLELNYFRAIERKKTIDQTIKLVAKQIISQADADKKIKELEEIDKKMNHSFWSSISAKNNK